MSIISELPSFASNFDANSTPQAVYQNGPGIQSPIAKFADQLRLRGIQFHETQGEAFPPDAQMHDLAATVPALVVSPRAEWGVAQTLKVMKDLDLYNKIPVSVKSGGHGYFNGATCPGIMLNLANLTSYRVKDEVLTLEPGCVLGRTVHILAKHGKAVPHGDCYGVGAGGHFTTAGWDLMLTRRYGIGCQSVIGGRVVLWDGTVVDVDENNHPALLHAMRGGATAGAGVVTEIRIRVIDEPARATWRLTPLTKEQLLKCVANRAFSKAESLPEDITVSFRFYFEKDREDVICSFNIFSLLTVSETLQHLQRHLGAEVASLVEDPALWNEKKLLDLRLLPASDMVAANPDMLSEVTSAKLHDNPLVFWNEGMIRREMGSSFLETSSHWLKTDCEAMLPKIYELFDSIKHLPVRERVYFLVILGGGETLRRQRECAMPIGKALARFEVHWDQEDEADSCRSLAGAVQDVLRPHEDARIDRPFRGDIWRQDQAHSKNDSLHTILSQYDRRWGWKRAGGGSRTLKL